MDMQGKYKKFLRSIYDMYKTNTIDIDIFKREMLAYFNVSMKTIEKYLREMYLLKLVDSNMNKVYNLYCSGKVNNFQPVKIKAEKFRPTEQIIEENFDIYKKIQMKCYSQELMEQNLEDINDLIKKSTKNVKELEICVD